MKVKLRYILTVAFTIVAAAPVLVIGFWVEHNALGKEVDAAWEKHLLIGDHTAALLERYAHDTEDAFAYFATLDPSDASNEAAALMAQRLGIRHFCVLDKNGGIVSEVRTEPGTGGAFDAAIVAALRSLVHNHVDFSGVMRDPGGRPTIYMAQELDGGGLALAALDPGYLVELQSTISIGQKGYAAIVDHQGHVIAHPSEAWRREAKSLAALEPVKRTMVKERGVTTFESDLTGMKMIAAYTIVPETGWGVLVLQPFAELIEKARDVKQVAYILVLCGILAAAIISWVFADRLTRPLDAVRAAARRIAGGKLTARVPPLPSWTSSDLRELAQDFNEMADRIQNNQTDLAAALSRAQSADHAKSRFLANMSHELRTPLNAIIGFSQTMERQMFGPIGCERYQAYAMDIRRSGEHLLSIINYILDLSKIEGGDVVIEDDMVDVGALVTDVQAMLQSQAGNGQIALKADLPAHLPGFRGSQVKLKQILVNLVSNAVKYTQPGGEVVVSAWQSQGGGLSISVRDTGIGMSKADVTVALLPFGRVEHDKVQRINGSGLGLPIAKRFVEIHGGRLEISSERGVGTTITVHLPAARTVAAVA